MGGLTSHTTEVTGESDVMLHGTTTSVLAAVLEGAVTFICGTAEIGIIQVL